MHGRLWTVAAVAGAAVVLVAAPAGAHVGVEPSEATQGGEATLTFRVPNERDDATTTQVEVNMPEGSTIAAASVRPVPGWTAEVTTTPLDEPVENDEGEEVTEGVSKVTFSGGSIEAGQFQDFAIELGPLPEDSDTAVFPTLQTYDDGEVVRWIDEPTEGGTEPEHPAPAIALEKGSGDDHGNPGAEGGSDEAAASDAGSDVTKSDVDDATRLATIGIVLGVIGIAVAAFVLVRRRSA